VHKKHYWTFFKYLAGILLWFIVLSVLQAYCIWNGPRIIDGLWTEPINNQLTSNLIGSVAYRTSGMKCDDKFIYLVRYYPDDESEKYQSRSLSSLIDTGTWQHVSSDAVTTVFTDKSHQYILYNTSDGVYMKVFNK
jgi:hypothetical protein